MDLLNDIKGGCRRAMSCWSMQDDIVPTSASMLHPGHGLKLSLLATLNQF